MTIVESIKSFLRLESKCQKLIKYQARSLEFGSIGVGIEPITISINNIRTEIENIESASEIAKAIDDFQFYLCEAIKNNVQDEKWYSEMRIIAIMLLTSFRVTLEAYKINPSDHKDNLQKILESIYQFNNTVVSDFFTEGKTEKIQKCMTKTRKELLVSETDFQQLCQEMREQLVELGKKQDITIEKIDNLTKNVNELKQNSSTDSDLRFVDILILEENNELPIIEIKIRNVGSKVAFLKSIEFYVKKTWILYPPINYSVEPISKNYNIFLPLEETTPYTKLETISQSIGPNDVDRFTVTLDNELPIGKNYGVYLLKFALIYDEDSKRLESDFYLISAQKPSRVLGEFHPGGRYTESYNAKLGSTIPEIESTQAIRSKMVEKMIENFHKTKPKN